MIRLNSVNTWMPNLTVLGRLLASCASSSISTWNLEGQGRAERTFTGKGKRKVF